MIYCQKDHFAPAIPISQYHSLFWISMHFISLLNKLPTYRTCKSESTVLLKGP